MQGTRYARAVDPVDDPSRLPAVSSAPQSQSLFVEPWFRRVRDVDDDTLAGMLKLLVQLRRMKLALATAGAVGGALLFGLLRVENPVHALLIYGTLATFVGLPVFAGGTLAVRRLFLQEGARHGISKSATTLILTRAERRARFLSPFAREEDRIEALLRAVREPDRA